jgi:hypothetical protein
MLLNGVDFNGWPGGTISASHTERELEETVLAFRQSLVLLQEEDIPH